VATDIIGASGRAMLEALVAGTHDPAVLAALAKGRLRAKLLALREALAGGIVKSLHGRGRPPWRMKMVLSPGDVGATWCREPDQE
jgi:hypothetical protein